jgi:hypothetical protein
MDGINGDFGVYQFKVNHPYASNNMPQMRSGGFQSPFISGGNQVAYYLGVKGNTDTQPESCGGCYSATEKILKHKKKISHH